MLEKNHFCECRLVKHMKLKTGECYKIISDKQRKSEQSSSNEYAGENW